MKVISELLDYTINAPNRINVFTANNEVIGGRLIMGGGAALACARAYPGIEELLGDRITERIWEDGFYGYIHVDFKGVSVGALQTKCEVRFPSTEELVRRSCKKMASVAQAYGHLEFHVNSPGTGLGGLKEEDILPMIEKIFPDNVTVYV